MSYLYGRLFRNGYGPYCPRGADFRTFYTFRAAVSSFIRHFRLHECHQPCRRTQHTVRADRNAELACSAVLREIAKAQCSWRNNRRRALRNLLLFDYCQTSVDLFLLGCHGCRCGKQGGCGQKTAAVAVYISGFSVCSRFFLLFCLVGLAYGSLVALLDAVHAGNTAAVVYCVGCHVNGRCLAVFLACLAVDTSGTLHDGLEP